jgi:nucleotide-binding universal stress UspA family protein
MKRVQQFGVSMAKTHIAFGDPAETIIDVVRRGARRRQAGAPTARGLLLGSVSQKLVTLTPAS